MILKTLKEYIESNIKEAVGLINETLSRHPEARQVYGLLRSLKKA